MRLAALTGSRQSSVEVTLALYEFAQGDAINDKDEILWKDNLLRVDVKEETMGVKDCKRIMRTLVLEVSQSATVS